MVLPTPPLGEATVMTLPEKVSWARRPDTLEAADSSAAPADDADEPAELSDAAEAAEPGRSGPGRRASSATLHADARTAAASESFSWRARNRRRQSRMGFAFRHVAQIADLRSDM